MKCLIGLGLTTCIKDLSNNLVSTEEVKAVLVGGPVNWTSLEAEVIKSIPEGVHIFNTLRNQGKIHFPSVEDGSWDLTVKGHWSTTYGEPYDPTRKEVTS